VYHIISLTFVYPKHSTKRLALVASQRWAIRPPQQSPRTYISRILYWNDRLVPPGVRIDMQSKVLHHCLVPRLVVKTILWERHTPNRTVHLRNTGYLTPLSGLWLFIWKLYHYNFLARRRKKEMTLFTWCFCSR